MVSTMYLVHLEQPFRPTFGHQETLNFPTGRRIEIFSEFSLSGTSKKTLIKMNSEDKLLKPLEAYHKLRQQRVDFTPLTIHSYFDLLRDRTKKAKFSELTFNILC